ncbi:MAG: hypothetical protein ACTIDX_17090 [Hafnia paralvei]
MNLITTLSVSLAPLLLSTQVQATSVAVPIANAQPTNIAPSARNRGMTAEAVLRLKGDVSQKLTHLFTVREKLDRALAKMQQAFDQGEYVDLPQTIVNSALAIIASAESTIDVTNDSFSRILSAERLVCRASLESLREETILGLTATIETMKKIPEFSKQLENREKTIVMIDQGRMALALNSDRIEMKSGMTREEKRRFILSQAS